MENLYNTLRRFSFLTVLIVLFHAVSTSAQAPFTATGQATNVTCAGMNDGSIDLVVTGAGGGPSTGTYCNPTVNSLPCNCPTTWDHINNFYTTGGSTNISALETDCTNPGAVQLGSNYFFYPDQIVTVNPGDVFSFGVQCGNNTTGCSSQFSQGFRIWVDWNDDDDMTDPGEEVWNSGTAGFQLFTGSITVPAGTPCGPKRMRVRSSFAGLPPAGNPCGSTSYGESEEFTVQVCSAADYIWSNGATSEDISNLGPGDYTVTITAGTESSVLTFTVTEPNNVPTPSLGTDQNFCVGNAIELYAGAAEAPGVTYEWSPASGLSCTSCWNTTASPDAPTTYYLHMFSGNCHKYDTIVFNVVVPIADAGPDVNLCYGDSIQLSTTPQAGQEYQWMPFVNTTCPTCDVTLVFPDTTTTYTITASMGTCFAVDSVVVNVTRVYPNAGPDVAICPGFGTTLTASGGATYTWSPMPDSSNMLSDTIFVSPYATSTYVLAASSSGFVCTDYDSVVVTVYPGAVATVSNDTTICYETQAVLTGGGGESYSWAPIDVVTNPSGQTTNAFPLDTTVFRLVVTDVNGCRDTAFVSVNVFPAPYLIVSDPQFIYYGESVMLEASGAASYVWTPDSSLQLASSPNPIATPSYSTTYTVIATTEESCVYVREVPVIVDRTSMVIAPNAFSPNGDGINDEFKIIVRGVFEVRNFQIFDRWGESMFQTNDADRGWNGMFNGQPAALGVYVYKIQGVDIDNQSILRTGNVLLLR